MINKLACWLYDKMDASWKPLIERKDQPMVRAIDFVASPCMYCTAWRLIFLAFGLGMIGGAMVPAWVAIPAGVIFALFVAVIVFSERVACPTEKP